MEHPETWHILPGESNWCDGDPYSIYLEHDGKSYCMLFIMPILLDIFDAYDLDVDMEGEEEQVYDILCELREYIISGGQICSALTYYLVHELIHWGLAE